MNYDSITREDDKLHHSTVQHFSSATMFLTNCYITFHPNFSAPKNKISFKERPIQISLFNTHPNSTHKCCLTVTTAQRSIQETIPSAH